MSFRRLVQRERGGALVLALVFLTIFGVLVPALLQLADTNVRYFAIAKGTDARVFAADWGVEYAIQRVASDPTLCPTAASGTMTITAPPGMNGRSVTTECQTMEGGSVATSPGLGYAVIVTSAAANALAVSSGGGAKVTGGPIFTAGDITNSALQQPLTLTGGDFQERVPCGTPTPPQNLVVTPPNIWRAVGSGCSPSISTPDPPHILPPVPTTVNPAPITITPTCRLFKPGKYTTAPALLSGAGTGNYFASGVYYFENSGVISIDSQVTVFAGAPPTGEVQKLPGLPCASDANSAGTATGQGVEFILGGTSAFNVKNNGLMELFTRKPTGSESPDISFYAVGATAGGYIASAAAGTVLDMQGGGAQLVIHGYVYAATASVGLFASSPAIADLSAGIIAFNLTLQASSSGGDKLAISVTPTLVTGPKRVRILGTAGGVSGEAPVSYQAVVLMTPVGSLFSPTVLSWRRI